MTDAAGRRASFEYGNGRLTTCELPGGQGLRFSYAPDGALAQIAGPGKFRTTFAWRSNEARPGKELLIGYANGSKEVIDLAVGALDDQKWDAKTNEGVAPIDATVLELIGDAATASAAFCLVTRH